MDDQRTLIEYLETNHGLYIEGNDWVADHRNTDLIEYFNISYAGVSGDNTVTRIDTGEDCPFGERSFGYNTNNFAANRPDHVRALEGSDVVLTCNRNSIRGVLNDAGAYRTYSQSVSFVGMNNRYNDDRAEFLMDVLEKLAGYQGSISGQVINNMTDEPVYEAEVEVVGCNLKVLTDEDGRFQIDRIPNQVFTLGVNRWGYTPFEVEIDFDGEEELEIEIRLLHPELELDPGAIEVQMDGNELREIDVTVTNPGDGPLDFSTRIRASQVQAQPWDQIAAHNSGDALNDTRLQAAIWHDGFFWFAGGNSSARNPNLFYKVNREGQLVEQWEQNTESSYGWRDLTTDGEFIYGVDSDYIAQIDPSTGQMTDNPIQSDELPNPTYAITYDAQNDVFWASSSTTDIVGINRNGELVGEVDNRNEFRISGLAWYEDDPDGYKLYITSMDDERNYEIVKVNVDNGESEHVIYFEEINGESPGGGEITTEYLPFTWSMVMQMQGREDWVRVLETGSNFFWVNLDPPDAQVNAEGELEMTLTVETENLEPDQEYSAYVQFDHNTPVEGAIWLELNVQVGEPQGGGDERELEVAFREGWNMISINVAPGDEFYEEGEDRGPDILLMMEQLGDHLELMKDGYGRFYSPGFNFNNIPYWDLTQGYMVNIDEHLVGTWMGEPIPADTEIPLRVGWNMISYFPAYELDASAPDFYVLSPIIDIVNVAKNGYGRFMTPSFRFSNMEPWRETQGYLVSVEERVAFSYPEEQGFVANAQEPIDAPVALSDRNMSVLVSVSGDHAGDQIVAVTTDGQIVGRSKILADGRCGIAVWGDEPHTEIVEGLRSGQSFELKLRAHDLGEPVDLDAVHFLSGDQLRYETDGFAALTAIANASVPQQYSLSKVYPNPFNSTAKITFALPETNVISLRIVDTNGRQVAELASGKFDAGSHTLNWNARDIGAGVYFVELSAGGFHQIQKAMLVK